MHNVFSSRQDMVLFYQNKPLQYMCPVTTCCTFYVPVAVGTQWHQLSVPLNNLLQTLLAQGY